MDICDFRLQTSVKFHTRPTEPATLSSNGIRYFMQVLTYR